MKRAGDEGNGSDADRPGHERGEGPLEPGGDEAAQGPNSRADDGEQRGAARHVGSVERDPPAHRDTREEGDRRRGRPSDLHR